MNNLNIRYICIFMAVCACTSSHTALANPTNSPPLSAIENLWVDSIMSTLTLEEKIGQLFIIRSATNDGKHLSSVVSRLHPGGIILKDVSIHTYISHINKLRRISTIPLLEVSDQTTSLHNHFTDLPHFPSPATLSALPNESVKQAIQNQLLADISTLGIHASFSPNIHYYQEGDTQYSDLNQKVNPAYIFEKAGKLVDDLNNRKVLSILQGVQFPTNSEVGNFPDQFSAFKHNGLSGMVFDDQIFTGTQFENKVPDFLKKYLQQQLQYSGLIIGELSNRATFIDFYYAGADVFILPETELEAVLSLVENLINQKVIDSDLIDEKVRKVLLAKSWLGLHKNTLSPLERSEVTARLFPTPKSQLNKLYEQSAITIPSNKIGLPLKTSYGKSRKIVHVSQERLGTLQRTAFEYINSNPHIYRPKKNNIINPLAFEGEEGLYIIALDQVNLSTEKNKVFLESIQHLAKSNDIVIINFGNPLNLQLFPEEYTVLQFFEKNPFTEKLAIQVLYGSAAAGGSMPVGLSPRIHYDYSFKTTIKRLKHSSPEQVGMKSEALYRIDEIVEQAIAQRAMPGCQVLVAKDGNIVYSKAFGHHTYDRQQRVERSDLYDIASVTKVAATTLAMMKLQEDGLADLEKSLGSQMDLPYRSTIKDITLNNLLIHKSGLQKNMPISTFLNKRKGTDCTTYFCDSQTDTHSQKIADNFYFNPQYQIDIWKSVNRLDRPNKYKYRKFLYSDVNFYILQQFIEANSNMGLDEYVNEHFYKPLGLRYCLYNPLNRLPKYMIVPTQDDQKWRNTLVRGKVHDETAALNNGIGGNAGLFANAEDLTILFQMLLNGGTYGGEEYLESGTIEHFTSAKHGNHRGLGFDKPMQTSTVSRQASAKTFGHNGFTGTCVWVDPDNNLIYIFLANRIHPEVGNRTLSRMGVRRKIHDAIYNAIDKTKQKEETILVNIGGE